MQKQNVPKTVPAPKKASPPAKQVSRSGKKKKKNKNNKRNAKSGKSLSPVERKYVEMLRNPRDNTTFIPRKYPCPGLAICAKSQNTLYTPTIVAGSTYTIHPVARIWNGTNYNTWCWNSTVSSSTATTLVNTGSGTSSVAAASIQDLAFRSVRFKVGYGGNAENCTGTVSVGYVPQAALDDIQVIPDNVMNLPDTVTMTMTEFVAKGGVEVFVKKASVAADDFITPNTTIDDIMVPILIFQGQPTTGFSLLIQYASSYEYRQSPSSSVVVTNGQNSITSPSDYAAYENALYYINLLPVVAAGVDIAATWAFPRIGHLMRQIGYGQP